MTIGTLTCNITIKGKEKKEPLHQDAASKRPELQFKQSAPRPAQSPAAPTETATEDKGANSTQRPVAAAGADPHRVADRVYDLIKEEIRTGRLRQGKF